MIEEKSTVREIVCCDRDCFLTVVEKKIKISIGTFYRYEYSLTIGVRVKRVLEIVLQVINKTLFNIYCFEN